MMRQTLPSLQIFGVGEKEKSSGARGGTRTLTLLLAADFESAASTNSATLAKENEGYFSENFYFDKCFLPCGAKKFSSHRRKSALEAEIDVEIAAHRRVNIIGFNFIATGIIERIFTIKEALHAGA